MSKYALAIIGSGLFAIGCARGEDMNGGDGGILLDGGADTDGADDADDDDGDADAGNDDDADGGNDADAGDDDNDDDGDDSGMDADGDDDGEGEPTCEQAMFSFDLEPSMEPPRVMLLLDKSRSMSNLWDHDLNAGTPEISRWHSLVNVVEFLTDEFSDTVDFGAQLFPSAAAFLDEPVNAMSCQVLEAPEVSVGPNTGAQIIASIPEATDFSISGGTPATAGVLSAIEHLESLDGNAPRAVVLITDGAANCSADEPADNTLFAYDEELANTVKMSFEAHSIPVYVVGINILDQMGTKPAVNAHEALTNVATLGGVPSTGSDTYYPSFNEIELAGAVEDVIGHIECTVPLQDVPDHPDLVSVSVDGVGYDQVADCDTGNGWAYTSPGGPFNAIQLCGEACEGVQDAGNVSVDYLCPE